MDELRLTTIAMRGNDVEAGDFRGSFGTMIVADNVEAKVQAGGKSG
jgi:hypothetical protein